MRTVTTRSTGALSMLRVNRIAATFATMLVLTACGNSTGAGDAKKAPIKIGAAFALTGYLASFDKPTLHGAQMAVDDINSNGGVNGTPLKLLVEDMKSLPNEAATVAIKLIVQDHVNLLISGASSAGTQAMAPIAEQHQVPIVSGSTLSVPPPAGTVSTVPNPLAEVTVRLQYAKLQHFTKVAVIHDPSPYALQQLKELEGAAPAAGMTLVANEAYASAASDLTALLSPMVGKADVIFKLGAGPTSLLAARNLAGMGAQIPLWLGTENIATLKQAGAAYGNVGAVVYAPQVPDAIKDPALKKATDTFLKLWNQKFPDEDPAVGGRGWDIIQIAVLGIKKAGSTNGPKMTVALTHLTYQGTNVKYTFTDSVHSDQGVPGKFATVTKDGVLKVVYDPAAKSG